MCDRHSVYGSGRNFDLHRDHGSYGYSGDPEYCCSNKYHSKHRHYTALCQLWRNLCGFSAMGEMGLALSVSSHKQQFFTYTKG